MAKKRANGEGSIRKRKDGRWEGRYTAGRDPETGKPIYKNVLGKTQAEVKEKLKAAMEENKKIDVSKAGQYKAEANDLIRKNPVRFADKLRTKGPTKRREAFTSQEVKILMSELPEDRMGHTIRLMLATGMRTQEVLSLEPQHIEPDGSCIHIRQAVNLVKGKPRIGPPKTTNSVRDIPIPQSVRPSVLFLRDQAGQFLWDSGVPGQPFDPAHFRRNFQAAVSALGVRPLTPHSCRHTYVSQLQALGVDMETIQSMVGHADIEMTQHYLHVQEKVRQAAARKLSKSLSPSR